MKKVLIIGSTGRIGTHVLNYTVETGKYTVTALARTPAKLDNSPVKDKISIVKGDITNLESLKAAISGQDVIISVVGSPSLTEKTSFNEDAAKAIASCVEPSQRWICLMGMSVLPAHEPDDGITFFESPECTVPKWLHFVMEDMNRAIRLVMASNCNWTVVCPPHIPSGALKYFPWFGMVGLFGRTRKYRTAVDKVLKNHSLTLGLVISEEDLADFFVKQIDDDSTIKHRVAIAY